MKIVVSRSERQSAQGRYGEVLRERGYSWERLLVFHRHQDALVYELVDSVWVEPIILPSPAAP